MTQLGHRGRPDPTVRNLGLATPPKGLGWVAAIERRGSRGAGSTPAEADGWRALMTYSAKLATTPATAGPPEWDHDWPTWHRMLLHYLHWLA